MVSSAQAQEAVAHTGVQSLYLQSVSKVDKALEGTLLVMGDSLSAAYGIEVNSGWVNLLKQKFANDPKFSNLNIHNASISGETTFGGKQRFAKLLAKWQPRWVILQLGANDALRGQNLKRTQQNLASMIEMCQAQSSPCQVLLLGIRLPTNYGPAYDQFLQGIYRDLAQKYQLVFDPFFLETVALEPDLMQKDGLHPNAKAQPKLLERLWPKIQRLLQLNKNLHLVS